MPTLTKLFSMAEVSEHNTKDDCWIVIDGKVYDVSSYMDEHPGGDDVMLETTGKDATDDFEDAGHSKSARELMEKFFIGEIDPSTTTIPEPKVVSRSMSQKAMDLTKRYWVVPVAIVGISVIAGFVFLRKKQ